MPSERARALTEGWRDYIDERDDEWTLAEIVRLAVELLDPHTQTCECGDWIRFNLRNLIRQRRRLMRAIG